MYTTDSLIKEHENISRFADFMYERLVGILKGEEVDVCLFRGAIEFVRKYADKLHHGKEEAVLFDYMMNELGDVAVKLVKHGMLVEHDLGRLYMSNLENALNEYEKESKIEYKLDIICAMSSYIELIKRHIGKENEVVFAFADRSLKDDLKNIIDDKSKEYEDETQKKSVEEKYIKWLDFYVQKYNK